MCVCVCVCVRACVRVCVCVHYYTTYLLKLALSFIYKKNKLSKCSNIHISHTHVVQVAPLNSTLHLAVFVSEHVSSPVAVITVNLTPLDWYLPIVQTHN